MVLMKQLIGIGAYSLPGALAMGGGTGWATATVMMLVFGAISLQTFVQVGRANERLANASGIHAETLHELWVRLMGHRSAVALDVSLLLLTLGSCVQALTAASLMLRKLSGTLQVPSQLASRSVLTIGTLLLILPACFKRHLTELTISSTIGIATELCERSRDHQPLR